MATARPLSREKLTPREARPLTLADSLALYSYTLRALCLTDCLWLLRSLATRLDASCSSVRGSSLIVMLSNHLKGISLITYPLENIVNRIILTPDDAGCSDSYWVQILRNCQRKHLQEFSNWFYLHNCHLDCAWDRKDRHEESIAEESSENIILRGQKLLGIDLVKDLQIHIGVKKEGVVAGHSRVPQDIIVTGDPPFLCQGLARAVRL